MEVTVEEFVRMRAEGAAFELMSAAILGKSMVH
jgi:hypothetical protein